MDRRPKTVYHISALEIKENLEIMKVSLRVLAALSDHAHPDPADIDTLRYYLAWDTPPANLDELACEVIKKALVRRAWIRAAVKEVERISNFESNLVYSPHAPDTPPSPLGGDSAPRRGMARVHAESEPAAKKQAE